MTTGRKLRNPGKTCSRNGSLTDNKPAGGMVDGRIFPRGKGFIMNIIIIVTIKPHTIKNKQLIQSCCERQAYFQQTFCL